MSITSYAQNFEDVMLWRALAHIERGSYIDIGAQDPIIDSVSLAFHERGWRGIHVEPTPHYAELLRQRRPSDTIIQAAVGNDPGVLRFFEIPGTGISTADVDIAIEHRERGFDVREISVPCVTLGAVFEASTGPEIHWLKIDVEGFERQVLSSWGNSAVRPWVVVVESTLPLTQTESQEGWEAIVLGYGYSAVYFDGLNRYYVSDAHPEIKAAFRAPPNVFDGFTLNGTASAPFHKLIEARCEERVSEAFAQLERQRLVANTEIESLGQSVASLRKLQAELEQNSAKREQEVAAQLSAIQQRAAEERAEQALSHNEQERALHRLLVERETALHARLEAGQLELRGSEQESAKREKILVEQNSQSSQALESLLRNQVQREREVAAQLLAMRQHADQERVEFKHERMRLEEALQHTQQLQAQQHDAELSARQAEHNRLMDACAAFGARLKAELVCEQQTSLQLRHALTHVQQSLQTTHASLTWRMTAPLRRLAWFNSPNENASEKSHDVGATTDAVSPVTEQSRSINVQDSFAEPAPPSATGFDEAVEAVTSQALTPSISESQAIDARDASMESIMLSSIQATGSGSASASTLETLLAHHDHQFVRSAYQTLLGREPDTDGLNYYLRRLRAGISKIHILRQLRLSSESNARGADLPGLNAAIQRYQRGQLPLVGWLFRAMNGAEGNGSVERKLRGVENQLLQLSDESSRRFSQMEVALSGLKHLVIQQTQSVVAASGSIPPVIMETQDTIIQADAESIERLSPRARAIYSQLKTAAVVHAGKAA